MSIVPHGNFSGRVLIVFGCGYVGSAVVDAALAAGMIVIAVTRNTATAQTLRAKGVRTVVTDLADDQWHDELTGAPDFALNCVSAANPDAEGYRSSYLRGMESIARWTSRRGELGTIVYTSSTAVYPQSGGAVVDENASVGGNDRADILVAAERALAQSVRCRRWFVLRLAGIYGPGRHHLIEQVRAGVVAGTGEAHLNLVHRDDVVAAVLRCFAAQASVGNACFNVADDGAAPKRIMVEWLARRMALPDPTFSGRPAGGRRAVTPDRVIANAGAKAILGWCPKYPSYREGYEAILARGE
jgi:nucleoside-diphosphate-sugar epimerase